MRIFSGIIIVSISIAAVLGLVAAGSPSQARRERLDEMRRNHLSQIRWAVESYYSASGTLPINIDDLRHANMVAQYGGQDVLNDPTTRELYGYEVLGDRTYKLCATFETVYEGDPYRGPIGIGSIDPYSMPHPVGHYCIEQVIVIPENQTGEPLVKEVIPVR